MKNDKFSTVIFLLLGCSALTEVTAQNPCEGLFFGQIVPNPDRCDAYFVCILTIPTLVECEPKKIFDPSEKACVPGDPETCTFGEVTTTQEPITTQESITTQTPETTDATTTTAPPPDLDEICRGVFFAAKPYPNSLEIYVGCIRGSGVLFTCFEDEFFHPVINECLKWPETTQTPTIPTEEETTVTNQPPSTTEIPETTTTPIPTTTESNLEGICDGKRFEYIEHPTTCSLFIFCFEERLILRQCPESKIFDIAIEDCRPGDAETCEFFTEITDPVTEPDTTTEATQVPTTEATEVPTTEATEVPTTEVPTTTENVTTVGNPCAGRNSGNVPNPNDCTQYFRCAFQIAIPSQCQNNQIFDPSRGFCANGDPSTCELAV